MARKRYSREFKVSAVKLVTEQGYTVAEAAKSLGVDRTSIRSWLNKFASDAGAAASGATSVEAELRRLREEN